MKTDTTRRKLAFALALLLVPTAVVGWVGLDNIGRLETEISESLDREAGITLHSADRLCHQRISELFDRILLNLAGLPEADRAAAIRALQLTPPDEAVLTAFRLDNQVRVFQPQLPVRRRTTSDFPTFFPQQAQGLGPVLRRIREARRILATPGLGAEQAYLHLQELRSTGNRNAAALLTLELAGLARGLGRLDEARGLLASLRRTLESRKGEPTPVLDLSLTLAELESLAGEIESEKAGEEAGRLPEAVEACFGFLEAIAGGRFDRVPDGVLRFFFAKTEAILDRIASGEALDRLDRLRVRNLERETVRRLVERAIRDGVLPHRNQLLAAGDGWQALPLPAGGERELILLHRYPTLEGGVEFSGALLDFHKLFDPILHEIETRISRKGMPGRVRIEDETGAVMAGPEKTSEEAEDLGRRGLRKEIPLSAPLSRFRLVATADNPEDLLAGRRRSLLAKALLWIALAGIAGFGAFLLVRVLRRERELADLKTDFVSRVSHELKTPLSLIKMYGETLAMGRVGDPGKARSFARVIAKESDRLTRMIDNVLDFSRVERSRREYSPRRQRLDRLVREIADSYRPHLEDQGFDLKVDPLPPTEAVVDPEGFTQALVNLLGNARKYTGNEEKRIELRLSRNGRTAVIEVMDRGVGVPDIEKERIFESFYRASTAGTSRGAGIGLALVKHFAEAHGGAASCRDREGGGSVFSITLPIAGDEPGTSQRT